MSKGFLYDTGDELITREDVNEVPDGSTASAGDVLSLDSNKSPVWSAPSGGDSNTLYVSCVFNDIIHTVSFYNIDDVDFQTKLSFSDMVGKIVIVLSEYQIMAFISVKEGEEGGEPWKYLAGKIIMVGGEKLVVYWIEDEAPTDNKTDFPFVNVTKITYDPIN